MNTSRGIVGALLAACLLLGCGGIKGSGVLKKETREVEAFTRIKAGGAFRLVVTVGQAGPVLLAGDDNLLPLVKAEVVDGALELSTNKSVRPDLPLTATISVKELTHVTLSGASILDAKKLAGKEFQLKVSGASRCTLDGAVDALTIAVSGAGKVKADELKARKVKVIASGACRASVFASEALDVSLSGAGKVTYLGDPKKVTQNISGVGKLEKK